MRQFYQQFGRRSLTRTMGAAVVLAMLSTVLVAAGATAAPRSSGEGIGSLPQPGQLATDYPKPEPVLRAIYTHPQGRDGRVLFTVYDEGGRKILADAPGTQVSNGEDSVLVLEAGRLQDDEIYTWTARATDGAQRSAMTTERHYVATSEQATAGEFQPQSDDSVTTMTYGNPWGCEIDAEKGHPSRHAKEFIAAHAKTNCASYPTYTKINHNQWLYRSSWRGWIYVAKNESSCPGRTALNGQPLPRCNTTTSKPVMRSTVRWNCVDAFGKGSKFNYRHVADGAMLAGGTWYYDSDWSVTGPADSIGTVECGYYL